MSRKGKVTVVGAGFYGSTTAQRLAEYDIFEEVVLTDIVEGKPEGLALDMNQSRPVEGFETKVTGQTTGQAGEGYEVIGGSDIVIVTAGLPRKPGMSRMDLIETNAKIVRSVVENVAKYAPDAVLIVVSNPLDEMTALAAKVSGFPHQRVMGQAGMLDTARFSYFVAEKLAVPVGSVRTLTLGSHGDTMVPVPSACTVNGQPLAALLPADEIEQLVTRTRNGGGEIVALLKTGSAYYAPSAAAARMARAVAEDSGAVLPVCAWVDGEYGISLTLGSHGDTMVPVPSACTVNGQPLAALLPADEIEQLVTRTRNGGGEIVALLKTGSAYYAPSAAAARMARAVAEDSGAVLPVCAWVDGEYGISGVYLGVEAEIGREGVRRVVERDLTESELAALRTAAEAVRAKQADVASL